MTYFIYTVVLDIVSAHFITICCYIVQYDGIIWLTKIVKHCSYNSVNVKI